MNKAIGQGSTDIAHAVGFVPFLQIYTNPKQIHPERSRSDGVNMAFGQGSLRPFSPGALPGALPQATVNMAFCQESATSNPALRASAGFDGGQHSNSFTRLFVILAVLLATALSLCGCSRRFFRRRADNEAYAVLAEKDRDPIWKIEQFHVYPDPRARFAAPYNPDRPPMPPDDPAARYFAPNPQKPRKAGIAWVEGGGYLQLLEQWNSENRNLAQLRIQEENQSKYGGGIKQASYRLYANKPIAFIQKKKGPEVLPPPEVIGGKKKGREVLPPPQEINGKKIGKEVLPPPAEVDCPPGGDIVHVEREPFLITLEQAVELGLINSREFQARREDLYLTALPVTLQRFAFAAQFFFTEEAVRERIGRQLGDGPANRWRFDSATGFTKLFSTGALLSLQFANQTVINLTGNRPHTISVSDINLDLAQPLLRGGGRAVTLEPLTQVERDMVYEIRNYARFRKEFYVAIAGGGNPTVGSISPGFGGGVSVGSVAGLPGGRVSPGGAGRVILATGPVAQAQGYMPTLLAAAELRNERKNVVRLEKNLSDFRFFNLSGTTNALNVGDVELNLLEGRTAVLRAEQNHLTALDQFKQQLGVPVNLQLELDDTPIRPIKEHLKKYDRVFELIQDLTKKIDNAPDIKAPKKLRSDLRKLLTDHPMMQGTSASRNILLRWTELQNSNQPLIKKLREYEIDVPKLTKLIGVLLNEQSRIEGKGQSFDPQKLAQLRNLERQLSELNGKKILVEFELSLREFEKQPWNNLKQEDKRLESFAKSMGAVTGLFHKFADAGRQERLKGLRESWPDLPRVVVDGFDLIAAKLGLGEEMASRTALADRLDLMNAKAQVVDAWRQITIFANSLLGVFNVRYHMDSTTPPGAAKPLAFSGRRSRHQLILNGELPLVRKAERNSYRASLIAYERARRAYMAQQDSVVAGIRRQVRELKLVASDYRIQQQSVHLAYRQVAAAVERIALGLQGDPTSATTQLLNNQRSLVSAQNGLYRVWIDYQITRLQLFRDLGRMPLDSRGVWIDEFTSNHQSSATATDQRRFQGNQPPRRLPEELAPPAPLPEARLGRPQ